MDDRDEMPANVYSDQSDVVDNQHFNHSLLTTDNVTPQANPTILDSAGRIHHPP